MEQIKAAALLSSVELFLGEAHQKLTISISRNVLISLKK